MWDVRAIKLAEKGWMAMPLVNNRGLTLFEALATIVVSSLIIGTVISLVNFSTNSMNKLHSREVVMQESRTIMNHIVHTVRDRFVRATTDANFILKLDEIQKVKDVYNATVTVTTGNYTYYAFDAGSNTVSFNRMVDGQLLAQPLSDNVDAMTITLSEDNKKIEIELVMRLPDDSLHTSSMSIYIPQL